MGMTIEEAIEFKKHGYHTPLSSFKNIDDMDAQISKCAEYDRLALDTMRKYQQLQADYENRLKAEKVAMLEELKTEFEEITISEATVPNEIFWNMGANAMKKEIGTRIQEKIDRLKGNENGNE